MADITNPAEFQELVNKYKGKGKIPDKVYLSNQQKVFLSCLVYENMERTEAVKKAYPAQAGAPNNKLKSLASRILNTPRVQKVYNEMMEKQRADLIAENKWTRDNAVEALKFIYNVNKKEHERVEETYNQHIDFLLMKLEASGDMVEKQKLLDEIIKIRKERRASQVNNSAMIAAVSELNKMHGYNSERLVIENESVSELDKRLAQLSDDDLRKLAEEDNDTEEDESEEVS